MRAKRKRGLFWRIAFIGGLIYQGLFTPFMLVAGPWIAYGYGYDGIPWMLLPFIIAVLILCSVVVAYKWELVGGGMLVIESIFMMVWSQILEGHFSMNALLLFLPTLVVGVFFILSWYYNRGRTLDTKTD
ncbi:hypothetical protein ACFLWX_02455 [Chloroflexota bacterium]